MGADSWDQEDADFAFAAREPKRKTRVRPILFTFVVTVVTFLALLPAGFVVFPDDPEKFGALLFRVTMIVGGIAFVLFEGLAFKERRLLRQNPDFWSKRGS
jgi:hypothetical protein